MDWRGTWIRTRRHSAGIGGFAALSTVVLAFVVLLLVDATGASRAVAQTGRAGGQVTLTLGAYTTPREAYGQVLARFAARWADKGGATLRFEESYLGSGAQSRAIVEGFEADVAALSLEPDIERIAAAGLIRRDWRKAAKDGMVSRSVVVFAVRKGNPKQLRDWADLARPGIEILTPNPRTSGGAMWNILALYGAAQRGHVAGVPKGDDAAAFAFLKRVLANVTVMDKGARESITNFEKGVGDVALTYENEVLVARRKGLDYDMVIPRSTILIENPVAVVDAYAAKKGTLEIADAFVAYLVTPEAQRIFAEHGLRSVLPEVARETAAAYPPVPDLFTIAHFGGWGQTTPRFFGEGGIYQRAIAEVQRR